MSTKERFKSILGILGILAATPQQRRIEPLTSGDFSHPRSRVGTKQKPKRKRKNISAHRRVKIKFHMKG